MIFECLTTLLKMVHRAVLWQPACNEIISWSTGAHTAKLPWQLPVHQFTPSGAHHRDRFHPCLESEIRHAVGDVWARGTIGGILAWPLLMLGLVQG